MRLYRFANILIGIGVILVSLSVVKQCQASSLFDSIMAETYQKAWEGTGFYYNPFSGTASITTTTTIFPPDTRPTTIIENTQIYINYSTPGFNRRIKGLLYDPCEMQQVWPGAIRNILKGP